MKIKTKKPNLSSNNAKKLKAQNHSRYIRAELLNFPLKLGTFSFWLLAFCFFVTTSPTATAGEETPSEQLDPTGLLMPYLTVPSQDANITTVTMHNAKPQQKQQKQSQTIDTPAVSFDAQGTRRSEQKEPLAPSKVKGEESPLMQRPVSSASPQDDSKKHHQLPPSSLPVAESQNSHLRRQLRQANISIFKTQANNTNKNELQSIIDQIRSVEFELKTKTAQPVIVVEPVQQIEPNEVLPVAETPREAEQTEENQIESKQLHEPVTAETLQILESLSQHPDQPHNPFELAEVLFLSGHLKDAAMCYQQALNRTSPDETDSTQNRAWILFQIGNCLRDDDPTAAVKMYRKLITEHPESPWADLAKARRELIQWYQQDSPKMLIKENQP